tara:strand:- start:655 stop:1017 length:363 start_codon:yes stop_codon:yes gene_type:complete
MAKKEQKELEEPTLEDLEEEEDSDDIEPSAEEEEKEEVETESLEARVETEKKSVEDADESEGSFMSVDAAEKRNVKKSDLKLDEVVQDIQADEFTCSVCFLVLRNTALAKPRAKVCVDCV